MRITGGEARGRSVYVPHGILIRPTTDCVRESFFDIIPASGKSFLDLFAGSGAVGLEALSRGAASTVFIEKDARAADALKKNIKKMGFTSRAEVIRGDALKGTQRLVSQNRRFDIIFADPPYNQGMVGDMLALINPKELLAKDATFVIQHSKRETIRQTASLLLIEQRHYGDTVLSFFCAGRSDGQDGV